ncbi:transporter [Thioalkalivibrio sp.]|uniref:transporter n=1 Tax=Thioalkalivibrio sp. TaxID=2093813 RepID=UPI00356ABA3C
MKTAAACLTLALLAPLPAAAEPEETAAVQDQIDELKRAILSRDREIRTLLQRVEALETRVREAGASAAAEPEPAQLTETPVEPAAEAPGGQAEEGRRRAEAAVAAAEEAERREQQRLVRAAFEQTLIDRGGLLLPPRTLEVESSLSYISSSSDRIVIDGFTILPVLVVGDIVNERIRSEIVQGAATVRLGLPFDLQLEARVPFGYQHRETVTAENEESSLEDFGLGDVEIALSHQLMRGRGVLPDLLASLRWKSTTGDDPFSADASHELSLGSGFESWSSSLTAVHVADPVVFFGGLSYTYNEPVTTNAGRFESGDTWGGQIGLAIALNLDTSVSFAFDQQFTAASTLAGDRVPGSSVVTGTFAVGASYSVSPDLTLDFNVRLGVTEDSPDIQVNFGMPMRFRF